ncbi:MAG: pirin family protein [Gammaproteobacteria bacterium]|nr:pirin family protein [Gammaproteobacteria bacterium]MDH5692758.1 pirin family protein [Gammaproteobacteria bacterium]
MKKQRQLKQVIDSVQTLEGGGFPIRRPFPTRTMNYFDPFLLFDHMGPVDWPPNQAIGAPDHPHRGFETVTYMLEGHMQHKDSHGNKGDLNPGDVQWMTAGAGIVHSELPREDFLKSGGVMNGIQLWVNLPAEKKMTRPRYQDIPSDKLPTATSADGKVWVRVIAGESMGVNAVIDTHIPIIYLHFKIQPGGQVTQSIPDGLNAFLYILTGQLTIADSENAVTEAQMAVLSEGDAVRVSVPAQASEEASFVLLAGPPLNEPVARYGPFVMNTQREIYQAIEDFRAGRMGEIAPEL